MPARRVGPGGAAHTHGVGRAEGGRWCRPRPLRPLQPPVPSPESGPWSPGSAFSPQRAVRGRTAPLSASSAKLPDDRARLGGGALGGNTSSGPGRLAGPSRWRPAGGWRGRRALPGAGSPCPDGHPQPSSCLSATLCRSGPEACAAPGPCLVGGAEVAGRPLTPPPGGRALCLQSSTQEIGEELVNGLIYSISLRKVQLPHGGSKGQRWLGVSVGVPGTPRRARVPRASLVTPRGSLPGLSCPRAP